MDHLTIHCNPSDTLLIPFCNGGLQKGIRRVSEGYLKVAARRLANRDRFRRFRILIKELGLRIKNLKRSEDKKMALEENFFGLVGG